MIDRPPDEKVNEKENFMKKIIIAGAVAAIGLAGFSVAAYATETNSNTDKTAKVQKKELTEEQRAAKKAEREQKIKDELAQLVKDGKLTQDQADKLIAKRAELAKEREANKPTGKPSELTDEQKTKMKEARTKKQEEIKNWLKEQGIGEEYAKYLSRHGKHGKKSDKNTADSSEKSTKSTTKKEKGSSNNS